MKASTSETIWTVRGMTCAACEGRVCRILQTDPAIDRIQVSVLQGRVRFTHHENNEWTPEREEKLRTLLAQAGYQVVVDKTRLARGSAMTRQEYTRARKHFVITLFWATPLLILSMGSMVGVSIPGLRTLWRLTLEAIFSAAILWTHRSTIRKGLGELFARDYTMASLLTMGTLIAWGYSFVTLLTDAASLTHHSHLYFETAGMIFLFSSLGKMLESKAKVASNAALDSLIALTPPTAHRLHEQKEERVACSELSLGDRIRIRAGRRVPVDGVVEFGQGYLDRSLLTGESIPIAMQPNDRVQAGTLLQEGVLDVRVTALGEATELGQMIRLVERACASKAPLERIADKISRYFVPIVFTLATLTWIGQWLRTGSWEQALSYAMAVIVISCPCALGLATPTAITVGCSRAARLGILWKNAESLENFHHAQNFFFDKTGTLTIGQPSVLTWIGHTDPSWESDQKAIFALRSLSEHPLAQAILRFAKEHGHLDNLPLVTDYRAIVGVGIQGRVNGTMYRIGNSRTIASDLTQTWAQALSLAQEKGQTTLCVWKETPDGEKLIALIGIADAVRPYARDVVKYLHKQNRTVTMLTGDSQSVARHIGQLVGIHQDYQLANLYPKEKTQHIQAAQKRGQTVAMVGDGLNDAPALSQANLGIAMGEGTQVAFRAADVVLMDSRIERLADALALSNAVVRNIYQNLGWAVGYNALMIPFAAGLFEPWGYTIAPMWAAAAMSLSSVCVVSNALRLYRFQPVSHSWKYQDNEKLQDFYTKTLKADTLSTTTKRTPMEKTITIEGMMCKHCVRSVDKALRSIDGVADVLVSLEKKIAVVILNKEVSDDLLRQAIEAEEFEVVDIR